MSPFLRIRCHRCRIAARAACCVPGITLHLLLLTGVSTMLAQTDQSEGSMRGREEYFHEMRAWPFGRIPDGMRLAALDWMAARAKENGRTLQSQASWHPIGPFNLSGRITAIALHPADGKTLWAGAAAGGVWKSTNRGDSWRPVMDYENAITVGAIAVDPGNPDVVYVGTGEPAFNLDTYAGAGLFKSTDGGESWQVTGLTGSFAISRIVVHPRDGKIVFASAIHNNSGLYRSTDAGRSWRRILAEPVTDIAINPVNPDELWVCGGGYGVLRSIDGGLTFSPSGSGLVSGDSAAGRVSLQVAPSNPSILFALICVHTYGPEGAKHVTKICRSGNSGRSWEAVFNNAPDFLNNPGFPQGEYNNTIVIKPDDPDVVIAAGVYAYRTLDGGSTWALIGSGVHPDYHALVFDPTNPLRLYAGNDGGVYRSDQGGDVFLRRTTGLAVTQYYAMAIDQTAQDVTYGGTQDNGTVTTKAQAFDYADPGFIFQSDGFQVIVDPLDPTVLYHEIFYGNIYRTNVPIRQTIPLTNGLDLNEPASWSAPLAIDPVDKTTLYTARKRVYRMRSGDQWRPISDTVSGTITALGISSLDSRVMYSGSIRGEVRVTTDGGSSWSLASAGLPGRAVTDIVPSTRDTLTAWIAFSGFYNQHIYRTTNGGASWTSLGGRFPDIPVNTILVDPQNERMMFAGTDIGVLVTTNGGESWNEFGKGLPRVVVADMEIHRASRLLRVATHGRSMWEIELGDSVVAPGIVSPTGGEKWAGGTVQRISWGGIDQAQSLEYSLDDGMTWRAIAAGLAADYFDWIVPDTGTITARVRVVSANDPGTPALSRTFTIMPRIPGQAIAYDSKPAQLWGLVHDGSNLWAASVYGERFLLKIDPGTLATLEKIPLTFDTSYRNFTGLAWDPVRGTFFLGDVTHADPDGNGQSWILELDKDGNLLRTLPSPCGYTAGIAWLPDSSGSGGVLLASDLAGEQRFYLIDPADGATIRSYAPSKALFLGPAGLAPGPTPGTFWQILDDFSFEYGPRGSAALLMRLDDPNPLCAADLHLTPDSTVAFPPVTWGKISGAGVAFDPENQFLYVINFDGTLLKIIPCKPASPSGLPLPPTPIIASLQQNVPNPFSMSTEISIHLIRSSTGRLALFDMNGHEVRLLSAGRFSAGRTSFHIDAADLPSGLYRCVLSLQEGASWSVTMACMR